MKKLLYKIFSISFILFVPFLVNFSYCYWDNGNTCPDGDLLNCVFKEAKTRNTIVNLWNDKKAVWNAFLKSSSGFSWWQWIYENAPVIVKIVKIILKMTVVLSVTMVIFYSIKFMLEVFKWSDYKSAGAKKDLINVFIWLLIALFSITAVTLVISIPKKTLNNVGYNTSLENIYS